MTTTYNRHRPEVGATGKTHKSTAEAKASFRLHALGFVPDEAPYPITFSDKDGKSFTAKPDFVHRGTGVWLEYKAGSLNGLTTKAFADKALARFHEGEALGYVHDGNRQAQRWKASWSDSFHKQAIVVTELTPAKVVMVFKDEPSEKEAKRLDKAGVFYRTEKNISAFAFFLKLAAAGLDVGFSAPGHKFGTQAV